MTGNAVAAMIAHEIKQPLAGMTTYAYAGLRWLDRATPDVNEAKEAFRKITADGHRAGTVIDSIRAIFKGESQSRTSFDVNALIEETLVFLRGDLQKYRVTVDADAQCTITGGDRGADPVAAGPFEPDDKCDRVDGDHHGAAHSGCAYRTAKWQRRGLCFGYGARKSSRKTWSACSIRYSPRNHTVWGWACRSAAQSLKRTMVICGLPKHPSGGGVPV